MAKINDNREMFVFSCEDDSCMPTRQTKHSAGFDVVANEDIELKAGETSVIGTGVKIIKSPSNFYLELHPRSSFRRKLGVTGVGIIDTDYRDEIKLIATPNRDYFILKGERIGQLIAKQYFDVILGVEKDSDRLGGLGSTNN